jgi:ribosomal protein L25 (general stress protein Ctc)
MSRVLNADLRKEKGNKVRKLRRVDQVPAIMYAKEETPVAIKFDYNEFIKLYRAMEAAGEEQLVIDVQGDKKYTVRLQDRDCHPVSGLTRHVDFYIIK